MGDKAKARATVIKAGVPVVPGTEPGARIIHVGKRGGCKSTPQAFIERLMLMAAREGENVVRLKGGDPFIFGRGGEEVDTCAAGPPSAANDRTCDGRDEELLRLKAKLGEVTMANELLEQKITALGSRHVSNGRPLGRRRPRR